MYLIIIGRWDFLFKFSDLFLRTPTWGQSEHAINGSKDWDVEVPEEIPAMIL